MRALKLVCICVAALTFVAQAKDTYSVFSIGFASPMSSEAITDTMGGAKKLGMGWEAGWTFFKLPFSKSESALSGLGFGGKISYCRWMRDSTAKELTILGTQAIVRYYTPFHIKPFDLFIQGGLGMFIGEHGFSDTDTIPGYPPPDNGLVFTEGKKNIGVSLNIGLDWDVFEVSPGLTIDLTQEKSSAWLSLSAAMKF
jgi:hypothetical protein